MSREVCTDLRLLIQADVDGELGPAEASRVAAHLDQCDDCARLQTDLVGLSGRLRENVRRFQAPEGLCRAVRTKVAGRSAGRLAVLGQRWAVTGAAAALAACLVLFVAPPRSDPMPDWIVAAHIRALQPNHLVDVGSSEQHAVKPWFAGRLPFAPPVKDLSAEGFPLAGGRLDYLPGNTAAVIVYRLRGHAIDVFVWPAGDGDRGSGSGTREGYNFVRWRAGGMAFWAVSDLNANELGDFAALLR